VGQVVANGWVGAATNWIFARGGVGVVKGNSIACIGSRVVTSSTGSAVGKIIPSVTARTMAPITNRLVVMAAAIPAKASFKIVIRQIPLYRLYSLRVRAAAR